LAAGGGGGGGGGGGKSGAGGSSLAVSVSGSVVVSPSGSTAVCCSVESVDSAAVRRVPQWMQNLEPSGLVWPHESHSIDHPSLASDVQRVVRH
jgi:hypothetical protein